MQIEEDYRNILKHAHKDNLSYISLLKKRPSITYAITHYLLINKEFCSKGMNADKIKKLFESFGCDYSSSYISSSMTRNNQHIVITGTEVVDGNEVNIYKTK